MNFAIIGCGAVGEIHATVIDLIKGSKLVAIADKSEERVQEASQKFGCSAYTDYMEMLKRDDIDIVTICLPSWLHFQAAIDVAQAGKHCLVEKPIEIDVGRAEQMIECFYKHNMKLGIISQHRFDKAVQLVKSSNSLFGKLNYGTSKTYWYRDNDYYKSSTWRGTWKGDGGGALINQSIHSIDLLQHFMGPVESVCGKCSTLYHESMETEDLGIAILKFKNGALGTIEGTTLAYPGFHTEVKVFGQAGSVSIKNDELEFYSLKSGVVDEFEKLLKNGDEKIMYDYFNHNLVPHIRQFEDFIDSINKDRKPLVTGEDALHSLKIIKAIYQSSDNNEWIDVV